jgi:hypothetical protein
MISTIKNVNISGPINDFNKNLSTFFTDLLHLKCKTTSFFYFVLSFYAKRKDERKGAGTEPQASSAEPNDNFSQNGRLLHKPYWRYRLG